jgi:O-antigen ligase
LPIQIDFHPYYSQSNLLRPINGFPISVFDLFFLLALTSWLFKSVLFPDKKIRFFPNISIPFLLILLITSFGLADRNIELGIKFSVMWNAFKSLLIFLYIANNIERVTKARNIAYFLLMTGVIQSIIGIAQHLTQSNLGLSALTLSYSYYKEMAVGGEAVSRVGGTVGHPNKLALYLGMLLSINLALLFSPSEARTRKLLLISFLAMSVSMLFTYSRGGWGGSMVAGLFVLYACLFKRIRHRVISATLLVVCGSSIVFFMVAGVQPIRDRLFEDDYGAAAVRIPLNEVAINMIRDNPLLGVGLNNYTAEIRNYDTTRSAVSYGFPRPVHNEFLLMAAEQGLVVLALFLLMIFQTFFFLYRTSQQRDNTILPYLAIGLMGSLVAWTLHYQVEFAYSFFDEKTWVLLGLAQALFLL